jgi:hypothetical protein
MKEFTFYASEAKNTLYRYHVREADRVYYVTITMMTAESDGEYIGTKVLKNITRNDVIQECLSHCRRRHPREAILQRTVILTGIRNWIVCSFALLAFIRLMIIKN